MPFTILSGAHGDVKELEYIAALHQTCMPHTRRNGTIASSDVQALLSSRYGVRLSLEECKELVEGLGGVPYDDGNVYLDLVQILSLILLPLLLRSSQQNQEDAKALPQLFSEVVSMIRSNNALSVETLDTDMVRRILVDCGETGLAQKEALVREMVAVANGKLESESLVRAVTVDNGRVWNVASEEADSTRYYDVFGEDRDKALAREDVPKEEGPKLLHSAKVVDHSNADFVVDSHKSVVAAVLVWLYFVTLVGSFIDVIAAFDIGCREGKGAGACKFAEQVIFWALLGITLGLISSATIIPLSIGNNPFVRHDRPREALTLSAALLLAILPYTLRVVTADETGDFTATITFRGNFVSKIYTYNLLVGLLLFGMYIFYFYKDRDETNWEQALFSSNLRGEVQSKNASALKTLSLVHNALALHDVGVLSPESRSMIETTKHRTPSARTSADFAMWSFGVNDQETKTVGGLSWSWKRLYSGELMREDGIWLPSRLIVAQVQQVNVLILGCFLLPRLINYFVDQVKSLTDWAEDQSVRFGDGIIPKVPHVRISFSIAAGISLVCIAGIILAYVPSSIVTIMQFRRGGIPSLSNDDFAKYRASIDHTYYNGANAVYTLAGAGFSVFMFVGTLLFLFFWDATQEYMLVLLGYGVGIGLTIAIKMFLTTYCRKATLSGMYRLRPGISNWNTVILEAWYYGVASAAFVTRLGQILSTELDFANTHFVKDLLVHEAHRHPYIERLAQLYLMQWRHSFASDAYNAWRLVFVQTLFPWMRKYRVFATSLGNGASITREVKHNDDESEQPSV